MPHARSTSSTRTDPRPPGCSELASLCLYKLGHDDALRALTAVLESESFTLLPVGRTAFESALDQFAGYDDQAISFVDHTTAVLAANATSTCLDPVTASTDKAYLSSC